MTFGALRMKHRDVIITLTIHEILDEGMKAIAEKDYSGNMVGLEIQECAKDIQSAYETNYNNFRAIIKGGV